MSALNRIEPRTAQAHQERAPGVNPAPDLRVICGAANVPAAEWSALSGNPYEGPEWFRFSEATFPEMQFVYFCLFENRKLCAVLPTYDRHSPLYCDSVQVLPVASRSLLRGMRFLIAGSPASFCSDVIGPPRHAAALISFALSQATQRGFDLLSLPFLRSKLEHPLARSVESAVDFDLPITFESFDGYLATLNKSKRCNVRREMRQPTPITHLPLAGNEQLMHRLYVLTAGRNDAKGVVTPAFYAALAAAFGERARLAVAGDAADPKGALVYLLYGNAMWLLHAGLAARDLTYFQLVFYETIRLAAELGLKAINFRPSSDQAKLLRGCRRERLRLACIPASERGRLCLKQVREVIADILHVRSLARNGSPGRRPHRGEAAADSDLSFSAKVRQRMLSDRNPLLVEIQNKFTVREYARERRVAMAPLYSVIQDASELSPDELPPDCFIRASHGSKWNVIRRLGNSHLFADGSGHENRESPQSLSVAECRELFRHWLTAEYRPWEWAYTVMPKHILIEQILSPRVGPELMDYRFYTFDGQVQAINVGCASYRRRNQNAFFTPGWQLIPLTYYREALPEPPPDRPETLGEMLDAAARLGAGLDFVRVDLFDTTDGVMLGEMTIYPEGGRVDSPTACPIFNQWLGRHWQVAAPRQY